MFIRNVFVGLLVTAIPIMGSAQTSEVNCGGTYTVGPGDTLSRISIKAYGVSAYETIYAANKAAIGDNPNKLLIGQVLTIPCRGETAQSVEVAVEPEAPISSEPVIVTFNKVSDPRFVINVDIIDPYLQLIENTTQGRVQFVDPPEMNRDARAQFDLVTSGQIDATYVLNQYLAETHPLLQMPMIPLMGGSAEQTARSLWNLHDKYLSSTDYFTQAHLLGFIASPTAHIWRRTENPVTAGEDILAQNDYVIPYFEGLDTVGPPQVQAQNAAQYDLNDQSLTFMMAHGAARGAGLWPNGLGVTEVENGIYTPTFSVIISNAAWARISPADQETITRLSGAALALRSSAWDDFDNGHRQFMLDSGLQVAYPDGPLLREIEQAAQAGLEVWGRTASALGIPAEQAIASYRADLASLRYLLIFR